MLSIDSVHSSLLPLTSKCEQRANLSVFSVCVVGGFIGVWWPWTEPRKRTSNPGEDKNERPRREKNGDEGGTNRLPESTDFFLLLSLATPFVYPINPTNQGVTRNLNLSIPMPVSRKS